MAELGTGRGASGYGMGTGRRLAGGAIGVVLLVAGAAKLLSMETVAPDLTPAFLMRSLGDFSVPFQWLTRLSALVEIALGGALLVVRRPARLLFVLTSVLLVAFCLYHLSALLTKAELEGCRCFGDLVRPTHATASALSGVMLLGILYWAGHRER